jgi:hypothetical protein
MNEIQAREILGCSKTATLKELKASYRRMIVMVHPDKAGQDAISQERAKEASSRLNHAWEYLENREKQGLLGKVETESTTSYQSSRGRATYPHECDICGFAPATRISAPVITSFLYFLRRGKYELNACKACGLAMSRMALRETLIKGWWGFGLFFVPHAVYRYYENIRALDKIDMPSFRDPDVLTLSQYPFRIPISPFKELLPMITSALALLIIGSFLFAGNSTSSTTTFETADYYFGEVGSCYEETQTSEGVLLDLVKCGAATSTLLSVAVTDDQSQCPQETLYTTVASLPNGTKKVACLVSY